ncbi:MAG TPA: family 16 glycoside hydrolase [Ruminiclostridium sp.]|nr:family 16 glycoside hydrolase [Ruminiclostridium sp.]
MKPISGQNKKLRKLLAYVMVFSMALTVVPPITVNAESAGQLSVFSDNFSDGNADGWTMYKGNDVSKPFDWSVNSQNQLSVTGNTGAKAIADGTDFQDFVYEADVQVNGLNSDNSGLLFRVTNPTDVQGDGYNGYYAGIRIDKKVELGRVTAGGWKSLSTADLPGTSGHMKIVAVGNQIQVFVNDMSNPKINYTDNDGSEITSSGAIGVRTYWGTSSVDNISVREYSGTETAAPSFGVPAGVYETAQTVSINADPGAVVHYTTDGSMPNAGSPVYDPAFPISVTQTSTIKAYAQIDGQMASEIESRTYIIGKSSNSFTENFDDGDANGWTTYTGQTNTATWSAAGGRYVLSNAKGDKAMADGTQYDNFIYKADINPGSSKDSSGLVFRCSDPGNGCDNLSGYFVGININGYVQIGKNDSAANSGNGSWTELLRAVADVRANSDNQLMVYANGSHFYVYVNGSLVTEFTDTSYISGSVGIRGWNENGDVSFDNIDVSTISGLMEQVATPVLSPAPGTFSTSQQVSMECATSGAAIHYTTDGSTPNAGSPVYSSPLTISDTTTVKAYASKDGMLDSEIQSATYSKTTASFSDDFSDGTYNKWTTYGGSWSVTAGELHVGSGAGYKAIAKNTDFADLSYEADLKITGGTGDAGVLFRVSSATVGGDNVVGYYAGINPGNKSVILGRMNNSWTQLTSTKMDIAVNTTYHMKVVAFGSMIKVYVDDMTNPVISYIDNTYTHGAVGLRIYNSDVSYSNILAEEYSVPVAIDSFIPVQVTTKANEAPVLPGQVTAKYNNGTSSTVTVTWDAVPADSYANPGKFTVEGTVDGSTVKATATVTVAAAPLATGEAKTVPNQAPLVQTPFIPLPLGSVKADGWLLQQLELQKAGATGQAEELYKELGSDSAWLGGNAADSDWERPAYYVKGLVALAYTLGDSELEAKASKWIEWSLDSQKSDGSFGPVSNNDWWPRMPMLYAMKDYYEATGDSRVIPFMTKYFSYEAANLDKKPLSDWSEARVGDNIDTVLWLYNRTKDQSLLTLADKLRNQGYDNTDIYTNDNFFGFGTDFQPNHNVNVSEDIKMPAIYYQKSGSEADKNAFRIGDSNLLKYHGQITGMSSGSEFLAGLSSTQPVELCAIVERMQSDEEAQMILGDPYLGDQLEKIAFNALPGAISKDFKEHQYYSLPNQVQSTNGAHGHRQDYASGLTPSPDSGFPCCRFNMHMGWPYYVKNMWAATNDGGIAAMAYGPSSVSTKVQNQLVSIKEETNYPFEEQMQFTVNTASPIAFPLKLRIPEWCGSPVVTVNGTAQTGVVSGQYFTINRTWNDGDVVTLNVPMKIKTTAQVSNSVGVERGPLVYSLKIGENWVKKSERYPGFGEYDVLPTTPWNYGLVINKKDIEGSFTVNKGGMPENPFIQGTTPVTLTAIAKKLPSWGLGPNGMDADEVPLGPVVSDQPEEQITLVPFGAENLRVTYFPQLADSSTTTPKKYEAEDAVVTDAKVNNGGNNYSTSVSNGKYVGSIDNSDSSVKFSNIHADKAGTYKLEIAYASGSNGYATQKLTVNGANTQTVKYPPVDGWGKFTRTYAYVNLNEGNNTIEIAHDTNFAELDYIAVINPDNNLVVPVSTITITGQGGVKTITAKGGSLQMVAEITPDNATEKGVKWSIISGNNLATISPDGLLTALANGTVTVKAVSKDGYNIESNVFTVTITGQGTSDNGGTGNNGNNGSGNNSTGGSSSGNGSSGTVTPPDNGNTGNNEPAGKTFTDMKNYQWANEAVTKLAAEGIISGTSATTFTPAKNITRADFIVMLVKALNLKANVTENFTDVSSKAYYYKAVGIAKALGITNGRGDNRFDPISEISREDMMVLVVKALKATGIDLEAGTNSDLSAFKDANRVAGYASEAAATLIKEGIIKGSGNQINPKAQLTRAEAAVVIYKIFK